MTKPAVAYLAGFSAAPDKRMGRAGAIVSSSSGTAAVKAVVLEAARIPVARDPHGVADLLRRVLRKRLRIGVSPRRSRSAAVADTLTVSGVAESGGTKRGARADRQSAPVTPHFAG